MEESTLTLVIHKEINAPLERVFQAWVQPDLIKSWFFPGDTMAVASADVDLIEGGAYRIHMQNLEEKSDHIVYGTFKEIVKNNKLVFDWQWVDGVERTLVTVEFLSKGEALTLLTLTHEGFGQQAFVEKHTMGWNGCLENLMRHLFS